MNVTSPAPASCSQGAAQAPYACLQPPQLRGFARVQARLVDRIKRAAIGQLHRSAAGEIWLLRVYLVGEEATECALMEEWTQGAPDWLAAQVATHLADERHHAAAFARALRERGQPVPVPEQQAPGSLQPDRVSARKIAQWRRLALRHAPQFAHGLLVPAYATGLCAEQMAQRVLARHCDAIGPAHALHPLLARVLADEARHVQLCQATLQRLVSPQELPALQALLTEVRRIDRRWGISGAIGMYVLGQYQRITSKKLAAEPA